MSSPKTLLSRWTVAGVVFYLSSVPAFVGALVGVAYLRPPYHLETESIELDAFSRWDGKWYTSIVRDGYSCERDKRSNIAFFPVYPLLGALIAFGTGLDPTVALLLVANTAFLASIFLFQRYLSLREGGPDVANPSLAVVALVTMPPTFFLRMAYSESMFLLVLLIAMVAMKQRRALWICAILCGIVTATRAVGIAVLAPFAMHCMSELKGHRFRLTRSILYGVIGAWGLIAFMAYQAWAFGDPLAFVRAHMEQWIVRDARFSGPSKLQALLTLEPIWGTYVPSAPGYWKYMASDVLNPLVSLQFANPIYFVGAAMTVAIGAGRRWLSVPEVVLSIGLLGIPYVTRSYEMCMGGHARFAVVVFPVYIVLGRVLRDVPMTWVALGCVPCGFFMGMYAALFGAGYELF